MNNFQVSAVLISFGALMFPVLVTAQDVTGYLDDTADSAVRVEIELPEELAPPTDSSVWKKIRSFLGIRKQARVKPPIGTKFTVNSSAYASSPYQTDSTPCITAAGTRVRPGVVASNFLPIGTILEINNEKFIVEDRMNARYDGYFIDLWFPSTSSALEFGRKKLTVTVVGYGSAGDSIRPDKVAKSKEEEPEFEDPTIWGTIKSSVSFLTAVMTARSPAELNKYDVNCLAE
ncbi:MAG: 3D domain-containing protein [Candidatus Andersenbacteria bacterium]